MNLQEALIGSGKRELAEVLMFDSHASTHCWSYTVKWTALYPRNHSATVGVNSVYLITI